MRIVLLFFLLQIVASTRVEAQLLTYAIRYKDEPIGIMTAQRHGKTKSDFLIESKILIQKMVRVNIVYRITSQFDNNTLLHSLATQHNNGKEHINTKTTHSKYGYTVQSQKRESKISQKSIPYNLCKLYFEEPIGVFMVYSDTYGDFLNIKPAGKHRYELILPDGKSNFYTYHLGICILVEAEIIVGKIYFQLTNN
ncbi:MAG: hypothetical protein IPJ86_07070 [Bacteroidetes bacterium]|jgi:hypothetical protein|nr:hypothetical protein [Bacteroidota bacterium]